MHRHSVEGALRAGPDAHPPLNMRRAFIFQASVVSAAVLLVYAVEGTQTRRAQDEVKRDQAERSAHQHAGVEVVEVPSERDDNRSSREAVEPAHLEKGGNTLSIARSDSPVGVAG